MTPLTPQEASGGSETPNGDPSAIEAVEELTEAPMGSMLLWMPTNYKQRRLNAENRKFLEIYYGLLAQAGESRDMTCWAYDCHQPAQAWVFDVRFSLLEDPDRAVSRADYHGPIPGFCRSHCATAPAQLAEKVYFDRPEMQWGFKPKFWWVIFSDGTKTGGKCLEIDPKQLQPNVRLESV